MTNSTIEMEYQRRNDSMCPAERLARCSAMLAWTRQQIALQIKRQSAENAGLSDEELKLLVALRLYRNEPEVVKLIERRMQLVSG